MSIRTKLIILAGLTLLFVSTLFLFMLARRAKVPEALLPKPDEVSRGIVYRVTDGSSTLYLAGTLHVLTPKDFPPPAAYLKALEASGSIFFELDEKEGNATNIANVRAELGEVKNGEKMLWQALQPETAQKLKIWLAEQHLAEADYAAYRPWLASLAVSSHAMRKLGLGEEGLDKYLRQMALRSGKNVHGLETVREQFQAFASVSASTEDGMVAQALEQAAEAQTHLGEILSAWRRGDAALLQARMDKTFTHVPELRTNLLAKRNAAWLPKIRALLSTTETETICVGAAHLIGPAGLAETLRQAGYQVSAE